MHSNLPLTLTLRTQSASSQPHMNYGLNLKIHFEVRQYLFWSS